MRPPLTISRRVWIALPIGELVVDAMRRNPKHRTTFQCSVPQVIRKYSIHFGGMGQQTVISHSYTPAQRNPVEHQSGIERRPAEEEKGSDCPNVKESENRHRYPVDSISVHERPSNSVHCGLP